MALKMAKLFGNEARAENVDFEPPTTQVRMGIRSPDTFDPLTTMPSLDATRAASNSAPAAPKLPLIGNLPVVRQFQILGVLTIAFIALAVLMVYLDNRTATQQAMQASAATEMQMLSQRLARGSALAAQGQSAAFAAVRDSRDRFKMNLDALMAGGPFKGVTLDPTREPATVDTLAAIKARFERIDGAAKRLTDNEKSLTTLARGLAAINQDNSGLLELAQQAAHEIGQGGGSLREVDYANQLAVLSQRIAKNANTLASADEIDPEVAFLLGKDDVAFRDVVNGLAKGSDALRLAPVKSDDARATLTELAKRFGDYQSGVNGILSNMANLVVAKQAARSVNNEAEPLLADTTTLAAQYESGGKSRALTLGLAIALGVLALVCLALIAKVFLDDARVRAADSEHENKRNQEAILRLLNEMGNLADGDLTVQASVTEDVTGAIADSINFTIEELRTLVKGINSATDQVTKATQETQAISNRLYDASQRQNREIQQASASVLTMADSINEVAQNAAQSAKVAKAQLAAAAMGGSAVQNQIAGMNDIRSQIQETSKRIKRLGESSLEIGEIVELISDITEQTNVLALNAAIQAASAGEAGRGFTVVAEEVQRLAERSGEATKQIEAIVKTIQADTQDAVAAMEKSTVGVVEGAKLSDAAGQALGEIQRVSHELAELIGRISAQTQRQSASVSDVTRGMQGILRISEEATEGSKQTNGSIGQLTKLAAELRSSVAGFKV
jgi:twitching motility protein PilJ